MALCQIGDICQPRRMVTFFIVLAVLGFVAVRVQRTVKVAVIFGAYQLRPTDHFLKAEIGGRQVLVVGEDFIHTYTYEAPSRLRLKVGSLVEVPPSDYTPHTQVATVVGPGSGYSGPLKCVLRRLSEQEAVDFVPRVPNRTKTSARTNTGTMRARFSSLCPSCYRGVEAGDAITRSRGRWVHQRCA